MNSFVVLHFFSPQYFGDIELNIASKSHIPLRMLICHFLACKATALARYSHKVSLKDNLTNLEQANSTLKELTAGLTVTSVNLIKRTVSPMNKSITV